LGLEPHFLHARTSSILTSANNHILLAGFAALLGLVLGLTFEGCQVLVTNLMSYRAPATTAAICLMALMTWAAPAFCVQDALSSARSLESQGDYVQAEHAYQAALHHSPDSRQARLGLGRVLGKLGRCEESNRALEPLAASSRADVEGVLGDCYFRTHSFDQAIVHLELARQLRPNSKEAWIELGRAYASAGRTKEAINTWKSWLQQNPTDVDALYWVGSTYNSMAQNVSDEMERKDRNHYLVLELEGDQFRVKQEYEKALQSYQRALATNPNLPGLHFDVGDVYYQMMKYPEARQELGKELASNPDHARANFELGDIDIKQGRVEEGMPYLDRALRLNPGLSEAHRSRARGLLAEKRYEDAVRELLWVAKQSPSDHTVHAMLAGAYRQMGRLKEAQQEAAISAKLINQRAAGLEHLKAEEQELNDRPR
jgi:tetratricopeptide (TPR) repeat protein